MNRKQLIKEAHKLTQNDPIVLIHELAKALETTLKERDIAQTIETEHYITNPTSETLTDIAESVWFTGYGGTGANKAAPVLPSSGVSNTDDVIAEAREFIDGKAQSYGYTLIHRLADALEAKTGARVDLDSAEGVEAQIAARQSGEGEREALARELREGDDPVNTWEQATETQREFWRNEAARALSRAAVPDAATEVKANAKIADLVYENASLKAERYAALAAVERVRAIHYPVPAADVLPDKQLCANEACEGFYPCNTRTALDGAPE